MRVKQIKMRLDLDPSHQWKETVVFINYDNTDKGNQTYHKGIPEERFYVDLPKVVADALGCKTSRGKTQGEAFEKFKEDLKRFRNLKTERNKVILYEIKVKPHPTKDRRYFGSGYSIDVWADTYRETIAIAGDGTKRYSYERIESPVSFPGDECYSAVNRLEGRRYGCQVPMTKQNEAFFIWIGDRMSELISRLAELEDPNKMIENINAGRLLPLGEKT